MQQFQEEHTRLRFIRSLTGLTRLAIEQKYQLPEITLKKWETGKLAISDKGIAKCLEIYKQENIFTTYDWIKNGVGPLPSFIQKDADFDQDINYFKATYPNTLIHLVTNNEMMPRYQIGETVIGLIEDKEYSYYNNKDCIVILESDEIFFRRLIVQEKDKINLVCTNNLVESNFILYDIKPKTIAPVFWHKIL